MKKLETQESDNTEKLISFLQKGLFKIFIVVLVIALILGGIAFVNILPVDSENQENVNFLIENGEGTGSVIDKLYDQGLIRNTFVAKIYVRLSDGIAIYPGTYILSKSMSLDEIFTTLSTGNSLENEEHLVTFIEGKNMEYYIDKISEEFGFKKEDILSKLSDEEFLKSLIKDYWFIEEDILDKDIYFPLEGYIFPDTYAFRKDATIESVIKVLLDEMDHVLSNYKEDITSSSYSVHGLLTLASVVELEAVSEEDRAMVAGVFYNRLNKGIPLGSDVTSYYGVHKDLKEPLYDKEINECNAYNTRGTCAVKGLPVGPICSPSLSSIKAVLKPTDTDYLFFVADKNNKVYFAHTNEENIKKKNELIKNNLWPE